MRVSWEFSRKPDHYGRMRCRPERPVSRLSSSIMPSVDSPRPQHRRPASPRQAPPAARSLRLTSTAAPAGAARLPYPTTCFTPALCGGQSRDRSRRRVLGTSTLPFIAPVGGAHIPRSASRWPRRRRKAEQDTRCHIVGHARGRRRRALRADVVLYRRRARRVVRRDGAREGRRAVGARRDHRHGGGGLARARLPQRTEAAHAQAFTMLPCQF